MKKHIIHSIVFLLLVAYNLHAQTSTQMRNWYISPRKMDMSLSTPIPSTITPVSGSSVAPTAASVANGMYDDNNNLLFYVSDNNVFDYNNTFMGSIPSGGAEITIVPFGNNSDCQRKFNVFSTTGGFSSTSTLWRSVVDMNIFSITPILVDTISYQGLTSTEYGAIAVGQLTASNTRYLYFLAGPGTINSPEAAIKKITIHIDGSTTKNGRIYPTQSNPNSNAGGEVFAQELDLSPDGRWLAWASFASVNDPLGTQYRYHLLELDLDGDYINNSYKRFNIPIITGNNYVADFRGVEFYQSANSLKLFMGAGSDGIHYVILPWSNWANYPTPPPPTDFIQVVNSNQGYGFSQIELSHNGFMYSSSDPAINMIQNVGAFNPSLIIPLILRWPQSFTLSNPNPPKTTEGTGFYTLPDQIDGQDYSAIEKQASKE
ncbi:MAG TPA: hypothetical protein PKH65_04795 [Bacteroidia bacterium]|nr:hypothetical protein [Bacteroidia bacterium]HNT79979.1 hypothetical protein [Bacteroidia bacterium]